MNACYRSVKSIPVSRFCRWLLSIPIIKTSRPASHHSLLLFAVLRFPSHKGINGPLQQPGMVLFDSMCSAISFSQRFPVKRQQFARHIHDLFSGNVHAQLITHPRLQRDTDPRFSANTGAEPTYRKVFSYSFPLFATRHGAAG